MVEVVAVSNAPRRLVYVTGMAGAGMATLLKALEDLGYEAVDNLRPSLIPDLVTHGAAAGSGLAVGIDSRNADFQATALLQQIEAMRATDGLTATLVLLDCDDDVLLRRFSETRRRHPLAIDRPVGDGIQRERAILEPLRAAADLVLDTSLFSVHDLRRWAAGQFQRGLNSGLTIFVTSFAFRSGLPREADLVIDVRFLKNPHWDVALRPLTGLDAPVGQAIAQDPDFLTTLNRLTDWLTPLLPRYTQEGKSYLTIAVGCTGGRHRSVYMAEQLAQRLAAAGHIVGVQHRDLGRGLNADVKTERSDAG